MMNTDGNLNLHVKKIKFNYKFTRYHYIVKFMFKTNMQTSYNTYLTCRYINVGKLYIQASYIIDVHSYLLPGLLDSQCTRKPILK